MISDYSYKENVKTKIEKLQKIVKIFPLCNVEMNIENIIYYNTNQILTLLKFLLQ